MHHQSTRSLPFIELITFISVYLSNFRCFSRCLSLAFSFCFFYGFLSTPFGIFLWKANRQYVTNGQCQYYVRFFYFTVSKVEQEVSLDQRSFWLLCKLCLVVFKHFLYILNNRVCTAESFMVFAIQDQNVRNKRSVFRHRLHIERVISQLSRFQVICLVIGLKSPPIRTKTSLFRSWISRTRFRGKQLIFLSQGSRLGKQN